jgi:hypothetical protein
MYGAHARERQVEDHGGTMDQQDRPGWNPPATPDEIASSEPASPRRSRIGTGVAVAAIGIGALGIAGTAYAASASTSPSPSPTTPGYGRLNGQNGPGGMMGGQPGQNGQPGYGMPGRGPGGPGDGDHGFGGRKPGMGMGMGAIHGTFVTPKQGGGYQTIDTQRGTVTAVSSTSISVKSEDGFTATYVVTADTVVNAQRDGIASIKVGDEVGVVGLENAGSTTAVQIMDKTQMGAGWKKLAPQKPGGGASPAPSSTTTS